MAERAGGPGSRVEAPSRAWSVHAHLGALAIAVAAPLLVLVAANIAIYAHGRLEAANSELARIGRLVAARSAATVDHARWIAARLAERPDARSADPGRCKPVLGQVLSLHPELANVLTVDASGQPVCLASDTIGAPRPWPVDPTVYLDAARRTGEFTIGRPVRGFVTGRWVVMLAQPLKDENGAFSGAVALPLDLARYEPADGMGEVAANVVVDIIGAGGILVASSRADKGLVGQAAPPIPGDAIVAEAGVAGTPWRVSVHRPVSTVLAPVYAATGASIAAVLLVLLASVALALVAARRITTPMRDLAEGIREVEAGRLASTVVESGPAEIAQLGRRFNIMLARLRQAQGELRMRELRLRNLFEQAADGIFLLTPDHRYLDANAEGLRMLGYSREELSRLRLADVLAPRERQRLDPEVSEMMSGAPHLATWEHVRKDGSTFMAEMSARRLSDAEYLAIVRDLTPRLRAEAARREAAERLRLAVEAGKVGLWDWDLRTDRVFYSREWKAMLGYGEHEVADDFSEWERRLHPDDLQRCLEGVRAYLAAPGAGYAVEFRMRHRDGGYRWILAQAAVVRGEDGRPARMLGSHVDITERRQAEEALREAYGRAMEAEEKERREISREVHDRIGQDLAAVKLNVSLALSMMPAEGGSAAEERLREAKKLVQSAIDHSRDVMAELRPPGLDDHGLAAALRTLAEAAAARLRIAVRVEADEPAGRLPKPLETALFRIAQEALNNVAKHAGARNVRIALRRGEGDMKLVVEDDGAGFDARAVAAGYGLQTMRERAHAAGAALSVDSEPGGGTRITVRSELAR